MQEKSLEATLKKLPHNAGVYQFFNSSEELIYVGKAKNLKKRVSSYFTKSHNVNRKTLRLVKDIVSIDYIVVNTEFDALLLENNLIKANQPRYNILLKDDKSFPHILITNEPYPRIYSTRRITKGKGEYYGPYASVKAMNNVLELIRKLYTIRTCKLDLKDKSISQGKFKKCLEYHIGNCLAPCESLQTRESYLEEIEQAKNILKGQLSIVRQHFKSKMIEASETLAFEQAENYKNKLTLLEKFQSKSLIVNLSIPDVDVFAVQDEDKKAFVNYMKITNGTITAVETFEISKKLDETETEILELVIYDARDKYKSRNRLVITNVKIDSWEEGIEYINPKIGDKKKLIDLAIKNITFYKKERYSQPFQPADSNKRVLEKLKTDLQLDKLPIRIECFDNSNLQGTNPVASMVCFLNGKPAKKEYRHYNIKTVQGPDDFGSMREIIFRRYRNLHQDEDSSKPDLLIVDGGKGQLSAAVTSLKELDLYGKIPIIGIAKRLEEIYYPEDQYPLHISKKSESLKLIQHLRDEAHRFAITFHRTKRSANSHTSVLDGISGIGETTKTKLLKHFKTVEQISNTSVTELSLIVGQFKAELIKAELGKKKGA